jgi:hypothetical protein
MVKQDILTGLVLDLLDEIDDLRARLEVLERMH